MIWDPSFREWDVVAHAYLELKLVAGPLFMLQLKHTHKTLVYEPLTHTQDSMTMTCTNTLICSMHWHTHEYIPWQTSMSHDMNILSNVLTHEYKLLKHFCCTNNHLRFTVCRKVQGGQGWRRTGNMTSVSVKCQWLQVRVVRGRLTKRDWNATDKSRCHAQPVCHVLKGTVNPYQCSTLTWKQILTVCLTTNTHTHTHTRTHKMMTLVSTLLLQTCETFQLTYFCSEQLTPLTKEEKYVQYKRAHHTHTPHMLLKWLAHRNVNYCDKTFLLFHSLMITYEHTKTSHLLLNMHPSIHTHKHTLYLHILLPCMLTNQPMSPG